MIDKIDDILKAVEVRVRDILGKDSEGSQIYFMFTGKMESWENLNRLKNQKP